MNYADRARFKAALQRNGAPAMIEEHARAAERLTAIEERLAALEETFALLSVPSPPALGAPDDGDEHENGLWRSQIIAALQPPPGPCSPQAGCDCPPTE